MRVPWQAIVFEYSLGKKGMKKAYDVVVVGGGIAGLTAAAYCARAGLSVLLCEKQDRTGGLVNSFKRNGFVYDQGIRAIENSGIVFPMLKQLGIEMNWVRSLVTLAIGSEKVIVTDTESLAEYQKMLDRLFPQSIADIALIMDEIRKITRYMEVLYGIDNPLFLDNYQDLGYVRKTLLPWLMRYLGTIGKIDRLNEPVVAYLSRFTKNKALIDIIAQHFFADTPTFFALSYFGLYCEYQYPMGGTGKLTDALYTYLKEHGVDVLLDCPVTAVDIEKHTLLDGIAYKKLIWAADLKALYRSVDEKQLSTRTLRFKRNLETKHGGDSIFTCYLAVDLPPSYFERLSTPHLFYTPSLVGQSTVDQTALDGSCHDKQKIKAYLKAYCAATTYEISIPALRDGSLAPEGRTGLIISTLASYQLFEKIEKDGWYEEAKFFVQDCMLEVLSGGIYPSLSEHVLDAFSASPLTLSRFTANSDGAITGWSFTEGEVAVVHSLKHITKSVRTSLPDVLQAGQWTFSPSGLPISIMTGKLASQEVIKQLKRSGA